MLRLIFTISIVVGVLSMAAGVMAAGYNWLAPPATVQPKPRAPVRPSAGESKSTPSAGTLGATSVAIIDTRHLRSY